MHRLANQIGESVLRDKRTKSYQPRHGKSDLQRLKQAVRKWWADITTFPWETHLALSRFDFR